MPDPSSQTRRTRSRRPLSPTQRATLAAVRDGKVTEDRWLYYHGLTTGGNRATIDALERRGLIATPSWTFAEMRGGSRVEPRPVTITPLGRGALLDD